MNEIVPISSRQPSTSSQVTVPEELHGAELGMFSNPGHLYKTMQGIVNTPKGDVSDSVYFDIGYMQLGRHTSLLRKAKLFCNLQFGAVVVGSFISAMTVIQLILMATNSAEPFLLQKETPALYAMMLMLLCVLTTAGFYGNGRFTKIDNLLAKASNREIKMESMLKEACSLLSKSGVALPESLLKIQPVISKEKVFNRILDKMDVKDIGALIELSYRLKEISAEASRAKEEILPLPELAFTGETQELLFRVSAALGLEDEDTPHSQVRLV